MADIDGELISFGAGGLAPPGTFLYKMRAIDLNCGSLTYRTWLALDEPDFTASQFSGTHCGGTINFSDITLLAVISV